MSREITNDVCPVCGCRYVESEHVPENPDPIHPPHTSGTHYVHEWRADPSQRGHATVSGCIEWHNAIQNDVWDALDPERTNQRHE